MGCVEAQDANRPGLQPSPPIGTQAGIAQKEGWHSWFAPWVLGLEGMGFNDQLLSCSVVWAHFSTCKALPSEHRAAITPLLCHRVVIRIQSGKAKEKPAQCQARRNSGIAVLCGKSGLQVACPSFSLKGLDAQGLEMSHKCHHPNSQIWFPNPCPQNKQTAKWGLPHPSDNCASLRWMTPCPSMVPITST